MRGESCVLSVSEIVDTVVEVVGGYSRQLDNFFIKLQVRGYSWYSSGGGGGDKVDIWIHSSLNYRLVDTVDTVVEVVGGYSRQLDTFFIELQVRGYNWYSSGGGGGIQ